MAISTRIYYLKLVRNSIAYHHQITVHFGVLISREGKREEREERWRERDTYGIIHVKMLPASQRERFAFAKLTR